MSKIAGLTYAYIAKKGPRALLLLHGTGGNEHDMLPFGEQLDPTAHLISPRGDVSENGMLRFFRRNPDGVFDYDDLAMRTENLAKFITSARKAHDLDEVIGVGYSNGANILLHLICLHPKILRAAMLLRPAVAALPKTIDPLHNLPIFVSAGERDELAPSADAVRIAATLKQAGAATTLSITSQGHRFGREDIENAREWLATITH